MADRQQLRPLSRQQRHRPDRRLGALSAHPAVVRAAGAAASSVGIVARAIQEPARAGLRFAVGQLRRHLRRLERFGRRARTLCTAAGVAARATRHPGSRHAAARRGQPDVLVQHHGRRRLPDRRLVLLGRARTEHPAETARPSARSAARLRDRLQMAAIRPRRALYRRLDRAAYPPQEEPRPSGDRVGGHHDDDLGAAGDPVRQLDRRRQKLSRDDCRHAKIAATEIPLHRQPQSRRAAARDAALLRQHRHLAPRCAAAQTR